MNDRRVNPSPFDDCKPAIAARLILFFTGVAILSGAVYLLAALIDGAT